MMTYAENDKRRTEAKITKDDPALIGQLLRLLDKHPEAQDTILKEINP